MKLISTFLFASLMTATALAELEDGVLEKGFYNTNNPAICQVNVLGFDSTSKELVTEAVGPNCRDRGLIFRYQKTPNESVWKGTKEARALTIVVASSRSFFLRGNGSNEAYFQKGD